MIAGMMAVSIHQMVLTHSIASLSLSLLPSPIVGYLAETPEEYASAILHVVRDCNGSSSSSSSSSSQSMITRRGKASVKRFSDEIFSAAFVNACEACQ